LQIGKTTLRCCVIHSEMLFVGQVGESCITVVVYVLKTDRDNI